MLISIEYPIPKLWEDFEAMLCDLYPDMQLYGRGGQKQLGIDLISLDGKHVIQAKKKSLSSDDISIKELKGWIEKTKELREVHEFEILSIATTKRRDANLQSELIQYNSTLPFKVKLLFWDDIEELISQNKVVQEKYYNSHLYEEDLIEQFSKGSLDEYIKTTLLSYDVSQETQRAFPSIDELVAELPFRLDPSVGHTLHLGSLAKDYKPFDTWCERVLVDAKPQEQSVNDIFKKGTRQQSEYASGHRVEPFLPVEWACSCIRQLSSEHCVAILATEMALLKWINYMHDLFTLLDSTEQPESLRGSEMFAELCSNISGSLKELQRLIRRGARALAAYSSLKRDRLKKGIPIYEDNNPIDNLQFYGYYGFRMKSFSYGTANAGECRASFYCTPLEYSEFLYEVVLGVTIWLRESDYPKGQTYNERFPPFTSFEVREYGWARTR